MSIGVSSSAFQNITSILSVAFGSRCVSVGESAFAGCTFMSKINEDNRLHIIGENAFAGCTSLTEVLFPQASQIGKNAFAGCTNITHVGIPKCTSIGVEAFKGCENLEVIDNGESVNILTISASAFIGCSKLYSIKLDNCTSIYDDAFYGCTNLTNINLHNCNAIYPSAFKGCSSLKTIILSKCENIGSYAFFSCGNLQNVYIYNSYCSIGANVFHTTLSTINENLLIHIPLSIIDIYKNNFRWSPYREHMVPLIASNQIMYKTNIRKAIAISNDVMINEEIKGNAYYSNRYGLIEFNKSINKLNSGIFTQNTNVYYVDIADVCTHIGESAFEGCTGLGEINLPDNLKIIDDFAFKGCEDIRNIKLPDGLINIGESAFEDCKILGEIILPNTVENINAFAFKGCESLTSFKIPDSVVSLGEGIFAGCTNIEKFEGNKKFIIDDGQSVVYNNTLICAAPKYNGDGERRIVIGTNIKYLGKSCFKGCEKIMRIDIPSTVTEIHDGAFEGCTNLYEVHFKGSTPPAFGEGVFNGVSENCKIFVPVDSLADYCEALSGYVEMIYPMPKNKNIIYYSDRGIIENEIPTDIGVKNSNGKYYQINNYSSSTTKNYFNSIATNVTTVILGDGIRKIGESTFEGCTNLKYIYMPDTIKEFNRRCFYNCSSIERIHMPSHLDIVADQSGENVAFGDESFSGCSNLKEFGTYVKGRVSDDGRCYIFNKKLIYFAAGGKLNNYTIPDSITKINKYAFCGTDIQEIKLNGNISVISESMFKDCTKLTTISNWENIESIGIGAFSGCESLMEIELPINLKRMGSNAFYNCTKLNLKETNNNLGNITTVSANTFYNCQALTSVNLKNITAINESAFEGCKELAIDISTAKKLQTIGKNSFKNCEKLCETLKLPNKVQTIGNGAFMGCSCITTIKLPANLKSIGTNGLYTRTNGESIGVYIHSATTKPPTLTFENRIGPFGSNTLGIKIYIPDNITKSTYINDDGWKTYKTKIESIYVDTLEKHIDEIYRTDTSDIKISLLDLPENDSWKDEKIYFEAYNAELYGSEYSSSFNIPTISSSYDNTIIKSSEINNMRRINYIKIVDVDNVDIMYSGEKITIVNKDFVNLIN